MAKKKAKPSRVKPKGSRTTKSKAAKAKSKAKPKAPPKRRRVPRQSQLPGTEHPNADADLDAAIVDTYELTLTWQQAQKEMKAARDNLMRRLKDAGLEIYETHDGYVAKIVRPKSKITIKAADASKTVEIEDDE